MTNLFNHPSAPANDHTPIFFITDEDNRLNVQTAVRPFRDLPDFGAHGVGQFVAGVEEDFLSKQFFDESLAVEIKGRGFQLFGEERISFGQLLKNLGIDPEKALAMLGASTSEKPAETAAPSEPAAGAAS